MGELRDFTFEEFYELYKKGGIQPVTDTVVITQEMNDAFAMISGSTDPIHTDPQFARSFGYSDAVSYGLMYELISVRASEQQTGKNNIGYEWHALFRKPIIVGDTLHVKCEVESIVKSIKTVVKKITVTDDRGEVRSNITMKCKYFK